MTLQELSLELPSLKDEAKNLWGEEKEVISFHSVVFNKDESLETETNRYLDPEQDTTQTFELHAWQIKLFQLLLSSDPEQYLKDNS